jgi:hypothetical protein
MPLQISALIASKRQQRCSGHLYTTCQFEVTTEQPASTVNLHFTLGLHTMLHKRTPKSDQVEMPEGAET